MQHQSICTIILTGVVNLADLKITAVMKVGDVVINSSDAGVDDVQPRCESVRCQ